MNYCSIDVKMKLNSESFENLISSILILDYGYLLGKQYQEVKCCIEFYLDYLEILKKGEYNGILIIKILNEQLAGFHK